MNASTVRLFGASVGALTMLSAGPVMGGWWWSASLTGALAAVGSVADRHLAHAHVLATLVVGVGLAVESRMVPFVVAGTIGSIELGAAADRTSVVRPSASGLGSVAAATIGSAGLSGLILAMAALPRVALSGAVVVAAAAGVLATRVIAR